MAGNKVYMVTGRKGSGKTKFLQKLVKELSKSGVNVGGFIAEGTWHNKQRSGFILTPLKGAGHLELCTEVQKQGYISYGRFWFNPDAIRLGNEIIKKDIVESEIIVIDEVGIFELQEEIWYDSIEYLLRNTKKPVLISVREKIVNEVIDKFELKNVTQFNSEDNIHASTHSILEDISSHKSS